MRLSALLAALPAEHAPRSAPSSDPVIRGITYDSRSVSPGDLFVALVGTVSNGHDYLEAALKLGAADAGVIWDAMARQRGLEMIEVPSSFVHPLNYVLRVKGDSMNGENIEDGDFVIIKKTNTV